MQRCLIVFLIFVMDSALTQARIGGGGCHTSKECEGNLLCTMIEEDRHRPDYQSVCRKPCFKRLMPDPQEDVFCEANEDCQVEDVTYIDNWELTVGARQASLYIHG